MPTCLECGRAKVNKWYKNKTQCNACYCKQYQRENSKFYKKISRTSKLKRVYGIDDKEYRARSLAQNNVCAICSKKNSNKKHAGKLVIDHDHTTKKIRGLLCSKCNLALGNLQDSIVLLSRAIDYLKKSAA